MLSLTRKQKITWFSFIFSCKLLLFVFFAFEFSKNYPTEFKYNSLFIIDGETVSYYMPIESLAEGNGYSFKEQKVGSDEYLYFPSTRRVPGIAVLYYPLLKLMSVNAARSVLILLQFLLSTVSVYLLGLIALYLFSSYSAFVITLILYSASSFVSIFDHYGISESFSISFLIYGMYFSVKAAKQRGLQNYWWAGVFLCWSTFIRPAFGVCFPAAAVLIVYEYWKQKQLISLSFFKAMMLLGIPLLLCLSLWTYRNYKVSAKIIPLEDNVQKTQVFAYDARLVAIWDLIGAWGGQITRWSPNSMGEYFLSRKPVQSQEAFSSRMLSSECTFDSIKSLQQNYLLSYDKSHPFEQRLQLAHRVIEQSYRFRKTFVREKPFQYYVVSPLALTAKFYYFSTVSYLPFPSLQEMKLYQKAIKVFYILFFNLMLIGTIACIVLIIKKRILSNLIFLAFPFLYTAIMIGIYYASEQRYMAPVYPFLVLYAAYFVSLLLPRFKK